MFMYLHQQFKFKLVLLLINKYFSNYLFKEYSIILLFLNKSLFLTNKSTFDNTFIYLFFLYLKYDILLIWFYCSFLGKKNIQHARKAPQHKEMSLKEKAYTNIIINIMNLWIWMEAPSYSLGFCVLGL